MKNFLSVIKYIFLIMPLLINQAYSDGHNFNKTEFHTIFEGTWELLEWHEKGEVYKAPLVAGRCTISTNLNHCGIHKRFDSNNKTSWIGWGDYILENEKIGYRYTEVLFISDKPDTGIKLNTSLPWEGYKYFDVKIIDGDIYMTSENEKQLWNVYKDGTMTYTDKSSILSKGKEMKRVWKKIN